MFLFLSFFFFVLFLLNTYFYSKEDQGVVWCLSEGRIWSTGCPYLMQLMVETLCHPKDLSAQGTNQKLRFCFDSLDQALINQVRKHNWIHTCAFYAHHMLLKQYFMFRENHIKAANQAKCLTTIQKNQISLWPVVGVSLQMCKILGWTLSSSSVWF